MRGGGTVSAGHEKHKNARRVPVVSLRVFCGHSLTSAARSDIHDWTEQSLAASDGRGRRGPACEGFFGVGEFRQAAAVAVVFDQTAGLGQGRGDGAEEFMDLF